MYAIVPLNIRRIWKYEYVFVKYDCSKGKYPHSCCHGHFRSFSFLFIWSFGQKFGRPVFYLFSPGIWSNSPAHLLVSRKLVVYYGTGHLKSWCESIRPKPDGQINNNRTAKYFWPDDQTKRPKITIRLNIKHTKNPTCTSTIVYYCADNP